MRPRQIIRSQGAKGQHVVDVDEVEIPDLWHFHTAMKHAAEANPQHAERINAQADAIYETWNLCHDLLRHVKKMCGEDPRV